MHSLPAVARLLCLIRCYLLPPKIVFLSHSWMTLHLPILTCNMKSSGFKSRISIYPNRLLGFLCAVWALTLLLALLPHSGKFSITSKRSLCIFSSFLLIINLTIIIKYRWIKEIYR